MALRYNPKIITENLVLNLDPSHNKSYPIDLPVKDGLILWLDSSDDSTFSYSSGTTVSQWRDKSSSGYHMAPKSGGPTRSTFLNSRKVLAFTTSQTIGNNTINLFNSSYSVFLVHRLTGGANTRTLTADYALNLSNWLLGAWGGYVNQYYAEGWVQYQNYAADTAWSINMGDRDAVNDQASFYLNGSTIITNSTGSSAGPVGLGINWWSSEMSNCEVAEIIIYNKKLSNVERKLVHTYLGQKWGISNTDRSIIDLSGNGNDGLLGNGTVANMPVADYYNKNTLKFDGVNDYVFVNNPGTFSSYTFMFFCRWISDTLNGSRIFGIDNFGTYTIFTPSNVAFHYNQASGTTTILSSGVNVGLDQWCHVAVSVNPSFTKIYINGIYRNGTSTCPYLSVAGNFFIGAQNTTNVLSNSNVGSFQFYNRVLSDAEISQNYEAQKTKFINTIVQQGLVLNLDAGNPYSYAGAGSAIYDVSGSANNGTLNNSPTYSSDSNGILLFNGSSQYVGIANSSSLQVADTFTVSAWVKATDLSNRYGVFSTRANNTTGCWQFEVGTGNGGTGRIVLTGIGTFIAESVNSVITTNTWYHVTVVKVNNATQGATFYVNGSAVSNVGTAAYTISNNSDEKRIAIGTGSAQYFPGYIAQTFVYNRALSASEVLQNYNATKARFGL